MRDLQTRHRSSPWVQPLVRFHRAGGVPAPPGAQSHRASPHTQRLPPSSSSITWTGGTVPRTPPALCQGIWGSRAHPHPRRAAEQPVRMRRAMRRKARRSAECGGPGRTGPSGKGRCRRTHLCRCPEAPGLAVGRRGGCGSGAPAAAGGRCAAAAARVRSPKSSAAGAALRSQHRLPAAAPAQSPRELPGGPQPLGRCQRDASPPGAARRLLLPDPPHSRGEQRARVVSTDQRCQRKAPTSRPAPPGGASPSRCLTSICALSGSDSSGSFCRGLGAL